jgi:hypothetical protein
MAFRKSTLAGKQELTATLLTITALERRKKEINKIACGCEGGWIKKKEG